MNSSIRSHSLLDREAVVDSTSSTVTQLRTSKSECPFSVEIEANDDDIRLTSRSWSFCLTNHKKKSQASSWEDRLEHHREAEHHLCSNSVELIPVNSSSESDDSLSVEVDEEDNIVVLIEEEDEDAPNSKESSPSRRSSSSQQVPSSESHPLTAVLGRSKSTATDQPQPDVAALCAYDCFADHITSILCPVERHHIETTSQKSLPLEESSASVSSANPAPATANTLVCDPDALQIHLFPPPSTTEENEIDRSSLLFSSFNFWDSSAEEANRLRIKRLEQRQQRTPINRSRHSIKLRNLYLQQMMDTWHPPVLEEESHPSSSPNSYTATSGSLDALKRCKSFNCRSKRRVPSQQHTQPCYDSDPEQAFSRMRKRKASLLHPIKPCSSSAHDRFQSSMSLHVGTVGENNDDVAATTSEITDTSRHSAASGLSVSIEESCSTSYETAQNHVTVQPPLAPRHGDRISFDFVTTDKDRKQDGGEATGEEPILTASRESATSLSTAEQEHVPAVTSTESSIVTNATSAEEEEALTRHPRGTMQQLHMPLPVRCEPPFFRAPTEWTEFHLLYSPMDEFAKSHVQELSNVRFPLIWHPPVDQKKAKSALFAKAPTPVACHGVFEVGAHLDHMVVQPKFTWSPILQPNLQENRKILLSGSQPHSVELLSIIRVNTPSPNQRPSLTGSGWDRSIYPFCRLDRTLCVTTNDLTYPYLVFEARSKSERDWLVIALKLIVARLASIIIVRDEDMLLEFFSPYSALLQLDDDDDEEEEAERCKQSPSARDALDTLVLGKNSDRLPVETIVRDEDGDRQDVSMDDDDLTTDDEE
ncbi:hypothetical protein IV203_012540 [Nitzschia inconspicua]|uniref:Uncharacterized protein n=1 Tax=Nitzschia inconspicua TaxID=303405 RepID=A0A9K3KU11_9STRA|nr:hypothetical protein IV203_012540 [Nitzschia inconspicua]